ncbi:endo-1,4-beta-xylanase [Massilibacteroides sp.]|uniref:endo-1,4-beta-xylanase n=1 Tax=Massilibacteroides sp. TaxID=2034766 RepID=UPI0026124DAA|nr:endo-1,4-beta-xylanase [Massilibacteroides sp.]MDD4515500.1 endo-1,4-beta-xylanase [Massilibacteroides sp.]
MRNTLITLLALSLSVSLHAQYSFPKSMKEDKDKIMSEAYWKIWNPKVQAKIDNDIEKNRKADGAIILTDFAPDTEVKIEQVSHNFIFGAHIFNFNQLGKTEYNEKYKSLYGSLFNSATIAFYWKVFEMQPNRPRFVEEYWDTEEYWNNVAEPKKEPHWRRPATDPVVEFCESKGIRMHGHPLIWGNRKWHNPNWLIQNLMTEEEKAKMDKLILEYGNVENYLDSEKYTEEYKQMTAAQLEQTFPNFTKTLKERFEKRIVDIANYYGGRIHSWDVVNESATDHQRGLMVPGSGICKSHYGVMPGDYTYEAFKVATKVFPENVLLNINDYNLSQSYTDQTKDLLARNCKIDIMGSQMHLFNPQQCLDIAAGKDIQTPDHIWGWDKRLSEAKLPIHLSEITITAPGNDAKGKQIQAIITQNLYRLWFSLELMMGITWWNVVDDCGAPGEPSISGIFTRDMVAKPAYYALNNLINNEWKTNLKAKPDKNGEVKFRGFKGNYRITWTDKAGNTQTKEYYLK